MHVYPASNNVHDVSNLIETDTQLIIRYVLDEPYGEVVAFKVRVLRVLDIPIPMLITTFPKALQKLGLRAQKRAISGVPADIVFDEQGNREADGLIVDISKNGCQLFIAYESEKQQAEINETITLCVELAERTLLLSAKVKNIRIEKNFHAFGVEFEDPDNQLERLLERYVITL
jgi:c-di-GMP-binding flagellar brake protein YcgR